MIVSKTASIGVGTNTHMRLNPHHGSLSKRKKKDKDLDITKNMLCYAAIALGLTNPLSYAAFAATFLVLRQTSRTYLKTLAKQTIQSHSWIQIKLKEYYKSISSNNVANTINDVVIFSVTLLIVNALGLTILAPQVVGLGLLFLSLHMLPQQQLQEKLVPLPKVKLLV
jgi:hypothetical protein